MSELKSGITENMSLTEQELTQIIQMAMVGAVIDFVLHLMLYAIPAAFVGGILGIFGGFFRISRKQKSAETGVDSP